MAKAVVMPKAGITVESCIIGKWKKKPGDKIAVGDILFDYETDKASFECESTEEGILLECFFEDGDEVPVLVNVCAVGEAGEDASAHWHTKESVLSLQKVEGASGFFIVVYQPIEAHSH